MLTFAICEITLVLGLRSNWAIKFLGPMQTNFLHFALVMIGGLVLAKYFRVGE